MTKLRIPLWLVMVAALAAEGGVPSPAVAEEPVTPEPSFALSFSGPAGVEGPAGEPVAYSVTSQLETLGLEEGMRGAQGWSLSISAEGGAIVAATTAGTSVEDLIDPEPNSSFNLAELTAGEDNEGAVSAVALSYTKDFSLPPVGVVEILEVTLEVVPPEPGTDASGDPECVPATCRVMYRDDLVGSGRPVRNRITHGGLTYVPATSDLSTEVCPELQRPLNYGVVVLDPECDAEELGRSERRLTIPVPLPVAVDPQPVTAGIELTSALEALPPPSGSPDLGGVQGWSFSVGTEPCFALAGATTEGTDVETYFGDGFLKTELVDPTVEVDPDGDGPSPPAPQGQGAVSAVVLDYEQGNTLPPVGEFIVLRLEGALEASGLEEPGDTGAPCWIRVTPSGELGLKGSGRPVPTIATVDGLSRSAGTVDGRLELVAAEPPRFIRGNPNDDTKINIADAVWIASELYRDGPETLCPDAADVNDGGEVDASDVVYLLAYLFEGGPAPWPPFPDCGTDPTPDTLGECEATQQACR